MDNMIKEILKDEVSRLDKNDYIELNYKGCDKPAILINGLQPKEFDGEYGEETWEPPMWDIYCVRIVRNGEFKRTLCIPYKSISSYTITQIL